VPCLLALGRRRSRAPVHLAVTRPNRGSGSGSGASDICRYRFRPWIGSIALAAVRLLARGYFDTLLSVPQTGALFYLLAFGMISHWRTWMFLEYRELTCA